MYYSNPDGVSVHDGFPNPATDTSLQAIDLNNLLVRHSASTYFMRISGNEWAGQGIFAGDLAIADRSITARHNDPVVWVKDDLFVISPRHAAPTDSVIWGVVTAIIHQYRSR
ncbi:MAG TPA: S24 family peptidase [Candidatus Limnocylindrales bacterium]|nr:S24 family peptidase [Candidatus Limnocylindrales bacterium]